MNPDEPPTDLRPDPARPTALVLSGGGARGAFQVGAWDVLRSHPRGFGADPDVLSGTSAGALNAALIAAGRSPREVLSFWLDLAERPPVVANEKFFTAAERALRAALWREPTRGLGRRARELRIALGLLTKHRWYAPAGLLAALLEFALTARFDTVSEILDAIETPSLFDASPLRERLVAALGGPELRHTRVRLAINVVDVATGSVVRLVNHPPDKLPGSSASHYRVVPAITPEMLIASAAIPLLFAPVRVLGQNVWDGGVLVNTPLAPAVALGARRIVPLLVTPESKGTPDDPRSLGRAVERLVDTFLENAYNTDRKLLLDRNALAARLPDAGLRRVDLFRAIRPETSRVFNAGSYLYFYRDALLTMFDAGRRAALRWLEAGPELDRRDT